MSRSWLDKQVDDIQRVLAGARRPRCLYCRRQMAVRVEYRDCMETATGICLEGCPDQLLNRRRRGGREVIPTMIQRATYRSLAAELLEMGFIRLTSRERALAVLDQLEPDLQADYQIREDKSGAWWVERKTEKPE